MELHLINDEVAGANPACSIHLRGSSSVDRARKRFIAPCRHLLWSAAARRSFVTPLDYVANGGKRTASVPPQLAQNYIVWESCVEPQHSKDKRSEC